MAPCTCKRLRKDQTPPEEWKAHRKLRKKIASAKWYSKKKQREIAEQNAFRKHLEETLKPPDLLWPRVEDRLYWQAVLDHHVRGYPPRPYEVPVHDWCGWTNDVEMALQKVEREYTAWCVHIPWRDTNYLRILRQLGLRERRDKHAKGSTNKSNQNDSSESMMIGSLWGHLFAGLPWSGRPVAWWPTLLRAAHQTIPVHVIHHQPETPRQLPTPQPNQNHIHPRLQQDSLDSPRIPEEDTDSIALQRLRTVATQKDMEIWLNTYLFPLQATTEALDPCSTSSSTSLPDTQDNPLYELFGTESIDSADSLWSEPTPTPSPSPTRHHGTPTPSVPWI